MVEIIMGKFIDNNKKLIIIFWLLLFILSGRKSMAAFQEDQLFVQAYEYYLSYHPDKALEHFDLFLHNFPESSAADAALFWKAKSLIQLNRIDEAISIFSNITDTFPESPFFIFVQKELAFLSDRSIRPENMFASEKKTVAGEAEDPKRDEKLKELEREKVSLAMQLEELTKQKLLTEKGLTKAIEDNNHLEILLEETKQINKDLSTQLSSVQHTTQVESEIRKRKKIESEIATLLTERESLQAKLKNIEDKEIRELTDKLQQKDAESKSTAVTLQQARAEKEALEKSIGERDRSIAESEHTIAILNEKLREAEKERNRDKNDTRETLSRLSAEKTALENGLKQEQAKVRELTLQIEARDTHLKQISTAEEKKKAAEADALREQAATELGKLGAERDALQKKVEELQGKDKDIAALTGKLEEQVREKQAAETQLKKLAAENEVATEQLRVNEGRLSSLEEELQKERGKRAELAGKGDRAEILAKELRDAEENKKELERQIVLDRKQLSIYVNEKSTLLLRLNESENLLTTANRSLQELKNDHEQLKKTYTLHVDRETAMVNEMKALKNIVTQYEMPVLQIGMNQFSMRNILEDRLNSVEFARKIGNNAVIWRTGNPYNDFILEYQLLKKAKEEDIKEDTALFNTLIKQYSVTDRDKDYLLRYILINGVIEKKLAEIVADKNYIRKYYELNKDRYIITVDKKQLKMLSLRYSPQDELEMSLVAIGFHQQVANGESLENVYKYNSNVLSFGTVNMTNLPDFIKNKVADLKDGEITNVISYDNQFMILQMQGMKTGYRSFEDVYNEIQEKSFKDKTLQVSLLQGWFSELRNEAEFIR